STVALVSHECGSLDLIQRAVRQHILASLVDPVARPCSSGKPHGLGHCRINLSRSEIGKCRLVSCLRLGGGLVGTVHADQRAEAALETGPPTLIGRRASE